MKDARIPSSGDDRPEDSSRDDMLFVNRICDQFEQAWRRWREGVATEASNFQVQPTAESFAEQMPARLRGGAVRELIPIEMEYRTEGGQTLWLKEYTDRFPEIEIDWLIGLLQENVTGSVSRPKHEANDVDIQVDNARSSTEPLPLPKQFGQYEIVGKLGSGGMGTVYQAVHREMQRDVALKVMRSDLCGQELLRKRFRREVLAAARLVHPNIVTAYDAGEHEGQPFLVTELVHGTDLRQLIKQRGPVPVKDAIRFTRDAAKGLAYAHDHEIIHRDIKPANLLLSEDGIVKVLDMGLARLSVDSLTNRDTADETAELTQSGTVMGTATYMAPEQARSTRTADARSDIYSLGCVLFFLLEGRPPFRGESLVDTLLAHATEPIPELSWASQQERIPEVLQTLLQSMMAKSPEDRPSSMNEVVDLLTGLLDDPSADSVDVHSATSKIASQIAPKEIASSQISLPSTRAKRNSAPSSLRRLFRKRRIGVGVASLLFAAILWFSFVGVAEDRRDTLESKNLATMSVNRAVLFNGQNGYIEVPSIRRGPGEAVTIEIITRLDRIQTANSVSWLGENWMALFHNGGWGICRKHHDESLFAMWQNAENDLSGRWRHIAGTWNGDKLSVFVDGQSLPLHSIEFELGTTQPGLFIGGVDPDRLPRGQNLRFYAGAIDAIRISERVVYPAGQSFRPPSRFEATESTLALFQFDEPAGSTTFQDSSGNGHHGVSHQVDSIDIP